MKAARFLVGASAIAASSALLMPSAAVADHHRTGHWNRNYPTVTAVAQVYFEDFTGSAWPVYSSVLAWDDRPGYIRPYYKSAGTCNNSVVHCVPVRTQNIGSAYYGGVYSYTLGTNGHFKHGSASITYNTYYSYGDNLRREIVCHEIGHAMGPIGDGTNYTGTCMKPGSPYDFGPNGHDYDLLENGYNH